MKSLEFYSGIGGMHYALKQALPSAEVLAAFDINTTANVIYRFNFPQTYLRQCNIEAVSVKALDQWAADLWTMSPPCQPFTKKGLQLGEDDKRSDSFACLLEKLVQMSKPPSCILLENVVGFEESSVHRRLLDTLHSLGYKTQEFILSPIQYGVPNSRPRYYLLASLRPPFGGSEEICKEPPVPCTSEEVDKLGSYIEDSGDFEYMDQTTLAKYGKGMDIVSMDSRRSSCFTKSYGSYINGCGSYLCDRTGVVDASQLSHEARVRRFTPREMANLMCFPKSFVQPPGSTNKQMYRTLGNSVNVRVVAALLSYLTSH